MDTIMKLKRDLIVGKIENEKVKENKTQSPTVSIQRKASMEIGTEEQGRNKIKTRGYNATRKNVCHDNIEDTDTTKQIVQAYQ